MPTELALVTALGCALVGGVFFAFSTFVMRGLGRLPPAQGMAAMQAINVAAITPLFMAPLFGTGAACVWMAGSSVSGRALGLETGGGGFVLAGSLLYVAGSVVVTIVCNVPRNNALARADATSAEGAGLWASYQVSWTAWNHVRTVSSLAAAALVLAGLWQAR